MRGGMAERTALVDRWFELTRQALPALAASQRWPIRLDHCFMRVCLDEALDAPWFELVQRPAVKHLTDAQLLAAIHVAEAILAKPDLLLELNIRSLRKRGKGQGSALHPLKPEAPDPHHKE